MPKVSASILNCNHTKIAEEVKRAEKAGADYIHVDIMDGVYCRNLTFGPGMIEGIKSVTNLPVEVHLELYNVENIIPMFIKAGADIITFQLDACPNPFHAIRMIQEAGVKAGIGIGPSYSVDQVPYLLDKINVLTLMSVEPGYGGQPFEKSVYEKIRKVCDYRKTAGLFVPIQIDGGVNDQTAPKLTQEGADILIVGTYLFSADNMEERMIALKGDCK